jgi:hypothetical protein
LLAYLAKELAGAVHSQRSQKKSPIELRYVSGQTPPNRPHALTNGRSNWNWHSADDEHVVVSPHVMVGPAL